MGTAHSAADPDVVLITGCSKGGLGAAFAQAFHRKGCTVYATSRDPRTMECLSEGIRRLQLDVGDTQSIQQAVDKVIQEQGRIDILVNNAGLGQSGPVLEVDLDKARQVFETNVLGVLAVTQAVVPHMAERRRGKIVNVGSIAGILTMPLTGVYCATKHAVRSMTDAMRMELLPFNIQVMLLAPGVIHSNIWDKTASTSDVTRFKIFQQYQDIIAWGTTTALQQYKSDANVFATGVIKQVLKPSMPRQYYAGHMAAAVQLLSWLPLWAKEAALTWPFWSPLSFWRPTAPKPKAE